jgi:hypothetical protein
MDKLLDRIQELEKRTRKVEGQLLRWRVMAFLIGAGAIGLLYGLPGHAQQLGGTTTTFAAPFVVKGANGQTLFEVKEFVDRDRGNAQDTLMTFYRNGQPAAMVRTTGLSYKDAFDKDANFLNVLETWLYRYQDDQQRKINPTPYLTTSTALTRGGGSIVVFNAQGNQTMTPPFAARITAKRGVGGEVILYNPDGTEGKAIQPK